MPNYTHKRCSDEAGDVLRRARFIPGKTLPFNIELLSERLGFRVHVLQNLYWRAGLKGTGYRKLPEDRLEILVDQYHYDNQFFQCRFTIAEELSHLLIHAPVFDNIHSVEDRIAYERTLTEEQRAEFEGQATRFASYLLIPNSLFLQACHDWIEKHYEEIVADNPQDENDLITFLAERLHHKLEVSSVVVNKVLNRYQPNSNRRIVDAVIADSARPVIRPR